MTLSEPKSASTSARNFDGVPASALATWLDNDAVQLEGAPVRQDSHIAVVHYAAERLLRIDATLAYVDKGLDNIADLDANLPHRNHEVFTLLNDIRSLILTGELWPGTLATDRPVGGAR